jgi:Ulp1 protease family, C-terminal catalytic domain
MAKTRKNTSLVCHPRMRGSRASNNTCYSAKMLETIRDFHNKTVRATDETATATATATASASASASRSRSRSRATRHSQRKKNKGIGIGIGNKGKGNGKGKGKNGSRKQIFSNNVDDIVRELQQLYPHGERSWLDVLPIADASKSKYSKYFFSPRRPKEWRKNRKTWLSNFDILAILRQYEEIYPAFKFIEPSPIDFDDILENKKVCVTKALCGFTLQNHIANGKRKIGIVFNLDTHLQGGSHWVAMFLSVDNGIIFYFDSLGDPIPQRILKFVRRIMTEAVTIGQKLVYHSNIPHVHQKGSSECGMYCLYFIITMLTNASPMEKKIAYFKTAKITDKFIFSLRDKYFN